MKAKPEVLDVLSTMLAEELLALNQYMLHAEMQENWGYLRLSKEIRKLSIVEMKHAEALIERILFLEGTPNLSDFPKLNIGKNVKQQLQNDLALEKSAVGAYNKALAACARPATRVPPNCSRSCSSRKKRMKTSSIPNSASSRTSAWRSTWSSRPKINRLWVDPSF